jgi:hypothetical protein
LAAGERQCLFKSWPGSCGALQGTMLHPEMDMYIV